jgi:hypothetical protein
LPQHEKALAETIELAGQLPDPIRAASAQIGSVVEHEVTRVARLLEADRVERRIANKTPDVVADLYLRSTSDVERWVIEAQHRGGWQDVPFSTPPDPKGVALLAASSEKRSERGSNRITRH